MSTPIQTEEFIDYRPCWCPATADQTVQELLAGALKTPVRAQRRRFERRPYPTEVLVQIHRKSGTPAREVRPLFHVLARDLSQSGIGLIAPMYFEPEIASDLSPLVRTGKAFQSHTTLELGLKTHRGELLWVLGAVVRLRTIPNDLVEIGVRFVGRRIQIYQFMDPRYA